MCIVLRLICVRYFYDLTENPFKLRSLITLQFIVNNIIKKSTEADNTFYIIFYSDT